MFRMTEHFYHFIFIKSSLQRYFSKIIFLSLMFLIYDIGLSDTIYVPSDYTTIQEALNNAAWGDVIFVSPGTYGENLYISNNFVTVASIGGPVKTIIHGTGQDSTIILKNTSSTFKGFTIENGSSTYGGGIDIDSSSPKIVDCIIKNNQAKTYNGGGADIWNSTPTFIDCVIANNIAKERGGGIHCSGSAITMNNCLIINNTSEMYGGGMSLDFSGTPIINNCTFSGNHTNTYGGGIRVNECSPIVTNSIFWDNTAVSHGSEISLSVNATIDISYSDIRDGWSGIGNIDKDPEFSNGPEGNYYLSQLAAGQSKNSPCVDAGSDLSYLLGLNIYWTRTDEINDIGIVDMGSHFGPEIHSEPLEFNKKIIGNINSSCPIKDWTFTGLMGQQVQLTDVNSSNTNIFYDFKELSGWTGFEGISGNSNPITLPQNGQYFIRVYSINPSDNILYTFCLKETTIHPLNVPDQYNGEFIGSNQSVLFAIQNEEIIKGMPFRITLNDSSSFNSNELYVRFGLAPDRGNYDYAFDKPASPDQQIIIPSPLSTDNCYIFVYTNTIQSPSTYTLTTEQSDIYIISVSPNYHGCNSDAIIRITGAGFSENTNVELIETSGGMNYAADFIDIYSSTELIATFVAGQVPSDLYTVRISEGVVYDEIIDGFEMTQGIGAYLETDLVVPSTIGYHQVATIWIKYANTGDEAMKAPLLVLRADQNGNEKAIMKLGTSVPPEGFWTSAMPEGFSHVVQLLAAGDTPGLLQPGESFWVPVQYAGWLKPWDFTYPPINFKLNVLDADDPTVVDWTNLKAEMKPDLIDEDAWDALWVNFTDQVGTTWGNYVSMLSENAVYLAKMGQKVNDIGKLLSFEFSQADGMNIIHYIAYNIDAFVEAPGIDIIFERMFPITISKRYKLGLLGRGWSHNWDYRLQVEADGTVIISFPGNIIRTYKPDMRPGYDYLSMTGDHAVLSNLPGGEYELKEINGLIRVFNQSGQLEYIEDMNNNRITTIYSGSKLTGLSHNADPSLCLSIQYNQNDLISTITDPHGRTTNLSYDPVYKHLKTSEAFDGIVLNYTYGISVGITQKHALMEIEYPAPIAPDKAHLYYTYNDQGRLESRFRDNGYQLVKFTYDNTGYVMVNDCYSNEYKYSIDLLGMIIAVEDPFNNVTRVSYDEDLNVSKIKNAQELSYLYDFDNYGNIINITDPMFYSNQFNYENGSSRLTKFYDANGIETDYEYLNGNLVKIIYDVGHSSADYETYVYNNDGTVASKTNRRGNTITYDSYDSAGRLLEKNMINGTKVTYNYNSRGLIEYGTIEKGGQQLTTSFEYDSNDRITKITYPGGTKYLMYTYNDAGLRATCKDQDNNIIEYYYLPCGKINFVSNNIGEEIVHYYYDLAGRLEKKVLGNGVYAEHLYDNAWNIINLTNYKPDDTILSSFSYEYDSLNRCTKMITHLGEWIYQYDDIGQLTHWKYTKASLPKEIDYTYDSTGNRLMVSQDGGPSINYVVNNLNQYESIGSVNYSYDADGNMIEEDSSYGVISYDYDDENRLIEVNSSSGNWLFYYDAFGNRISVDDNTTRIDYIVEPVGFGNVVGEYNHNTGAAMSLYYHGYGLVCKNDILLGEFAYYNFDKIGNTIELTNDIINVLNNYVYDPFGNIEDEFETINNSLKYVGKYGIHDDDSGLLFMRARYYGSSFGRFLSTDPYNISSGDLNLYRYTGNNPVEYIDPTGFSYINGDPNSQCNRASDVTSHDRSLSGDVTSHDHH